MNQKYKCGEEVGWKYGDGNTIWGTVDYFDEETGLYTITLDENEADVYGLDR